MEADYSVCPNCKKERSLERTEKCNNCGSSWFLFDYFYEEEIQDLKHYGRIVIGTLILLLLINVGYRIFNCSIIFSTYFCI